MVQLPQVQEAEQVRVPRPGAPQALVPLHGVTVPGVQVPVPAVQVPQLPQPQVDRQVRFWVPQVPQLWLWMSPGVHAP